MKTSPCFSNPTVYFRIYQFQVLNRMLSLIEGDLSKYISLNSTLCGIHPSNMSNTLTVNRCTTYNDSKHHLAPHYGMTKWSLVSGKGYRNFYTKVNITISPLLVGSGKTILFIFTTIPYTVARCTTCLLLYFICLSNSILVTLGVCNITMQLLCSSVYFFNEIHRKWY